MRLRGLIVDEKIQTYLFKHDTLVSNRLMSLNYFSTYAGQNLISVPLEMQRYLNGVSDFLGSLMGSVMIFSPAHNGMHFSFTQELQL